VAFAVMGLAAGCWLLWERRWKQMVTLPWLPLLAMLAVCLPWGILVHQQEPDYWHYFFWVEHINRFLSPHGNRQHAEPFWYFIPVLFGGVFPWLVASGAMVLGWKKRRKLDSLTRLCLGWFVLGFLFFSASSGKLGTYILPLMPPLAILAARGLWRYLADKGYAAFKYGGLILVNVLILLLVALFANALWAIPMPLYGSGEFLKWVLACEGVVFWAAMILFAVRKSTSWKKRMVYFAVGPTLFMMNFSLVFPRWALDDYSAIAFLRQHTHRVQAEDMVFSDNYLVPSVNLVYERDDIYLLDGRGEFRYALGYEDSKHRRLSKDEFIELLARPAGERKPIVLVIKMHRYDDIKDRLPEPTYYDVGENYVFLRY
jgi:4-amino-4-deoxy-L-arabinose transferase